METNDIPKKPVSNWIPESDRLVQAVVGKLGEEAAELAKVCCRISIQGLHGINPATQKSNIDELTEEIADMYAMASHARRHLKLDDEVIGSRTLKKIEYKASWFEWLKDDE